MKEYGIDLQRQYKQLVNDKIGLIEKIKKRREFLIKNASMELLRKVCDDNNMHLIYSDDTSIETLLTHIIVIERAYTDQTKQLDMFDDE